MRCEHKIQDKRWGRRGGCVCVVETKMRHQHEGAAKKSSVVEALCCVLDACWQLPSLASTDAFFWPLSHGSKANKSGPRFPAVKNSTSSIIRKHRTQQSGRRAFYSLWRSWCTSHRTRARVWVHLGFGVNCWDAADPTMHCDTLAETCRCVSPMAAVQWHLRSRIAATCTVNRGARLKHVLGDMLC